MSPWDRIQSCVSCCCSAALNLWITAALLYGRPSLAHRTTHKDSSSSSHHRYVQSCCSAGGGCHTVLSSNNRMRTLLKSTAAPGCTLCHTPANHAQTATATGHCTKRWVMAQACGAMYIEVHYTLWTPQPQQKCQDAMLNEAHDAVGCWQKLCMVPYSVRSCLPHVPAQCYATTAQKAGLQTLPHPRQTGVRPSV